MNKIPDIASLEKVFFDEVLDLTTKISDEWPNIEQVGAGKTICLLFWEPSTRTKLSFEPVSYTHLTLPTMELV